MINTDTWEQRKLGESVSITSGEAPSKFEVGTELYVKVDDLNYNDKYVVDTQNKVAEHSTVKRVTKGSVVFPKRGAAIMTNKVRIMGIDGYMDTNMMALTSEKLDSEFLYNIISKEGLYKIADTSTIPQINNKHVEPYEVTIPSLDEQRKIGAYFKQLDHLITLHQRKLFLNFAKRNDWEQRKLNEVAEFNPKSELPDEFEYVDLESVVGTEMISHRTETKDSAPSRAQRLAQPGDVFFQTVRPYQKNNYLFSKLDNNYVFSTGYAQMRPNIDTAFLMSFLQTDSFVKIVLDNCTGTSYPAINSNDLSNLEISLPKSFEEQKKVGKTIISIDNLITLHRRAYYNKKGGLTNVHNDNQQHYAIL